MTDLHKPLGQKKKSTSGGLLSTGLYYLAAFSFIAFAGYGIYKTRLEPGQVVAINGSTVKVEPPKIPSEPKPPVQPTAAPAPVVAQKPTKAPAVQPDFKPRKPVLKRRPAGAQNSELVEKSKFGFLPIISSSGLRPLDAYSQAPSHIGKTRVAIVVGGLGLSQTGTKRAIEKLPSSITLAYSPIGNSLQRWMVAARKQGHEVVLQIPMEPFAYPAVNPGRGTLISAADPKQNIINLHQSLGRMSNYPIVMNYLGANFLNNPNQLRPILDEIKRRGLGWLDDGTVRASKSLDIAEAIGLPHANGSFVLDGNRDTKKIKGQLQGLELFAKRRGFAIATASAFPKSVKAIAEWAKNAEKRGIQIVPLSNLIRDYQN